MSCVKCKEFKYKKDENVGICTKFNWVILIDLAKKQRVCEE